MSFPVENRLGPGPKGESVYLVVIEHAAVLAKMGLLVLFVRALFPSCSLALFKRTCQRQAGIEVTLRAEDEWVPCVQYSYCVHWFWMHPGKLTPNRPKNRRRAGTAEGAVSVLLMDYSW